MSTGITLALIPKAPGDKIPLLSIGYGLRGLGGRFPVGLHRPQHLLDGVRDACAYRQGAGGFDKLKGKTISLVYLDSRFGKEPIPALEARAKIGWLQLEGDRRSLSGIEQKSQWLGIRPDKPDYVVMYGWGVMNGTAIKEAARVDYPRDKIIVVWWSGPSLT